MVTAKVGGLMAFATKKMSCIGCKVPLDHNGNVHLSSGFLVFRLCFYMALSITVYLQNFKKVS